MDENEMQKHKKKKLILKVPAMLWNKILRLLGDICKN